MSPTLTSSSHAANTAPTAAPEIDDSEYSVKPPSESWEKNGGSPQKSEWICYFVIREIRDFAVELTIKF